MPADMASSPRGNPREWHLDRPGAQPLHFWGWLIATVDSRKLRRARRDPDNWSEVRVFATTEDTYVVEWVAMSRDPGPRDVTLRIARSPEMVPDALLHPVSNDVTKTGTTALYRAAEKDDWLKPLLPPTPDA